MSERPKLTDWESKQATIALSKLRRERLRVFANGEGPGMSKAEAIYALIDTALPLNKQPEINTEAEATREIAHRSAEALERVAAALAPLEGLISDESELSLGGTSSAASLAASAWIAGALARLRADPATVAITLTWKSASITGTQVELLFTVSRFELDAQARYTATTALPLLAIAARLPTPLADISPSTLAQGATLLCVAHGPRWACELLAPGPAARPLHRFDC